MGPSASARQGAAKPGPRLKVDAIAWKFEGQQLEHVTYLSLIHI